MNICDGLKNKKCLANIVFLILWIVSIFFLVKCSNNQIKESKKLVEEIEYKDSLNRYNKIYYEGKFKDLKKSNKELYDSLKKYKNQVSYLVQFNYEKEYDTGIIHTQVKKEIVHDTVFTKEELVARTFEYFSEPNDTFQYNLKINSEKEPNWYSLKTKFKEKFTIVNKEDGNGMNHITIGSDNGGDINNVTVFKKKEKRKFVDRIGIGPAVTAGYDPINRNFGVMVGVGITYDLK